MNKFHALALVSIAFSTAMVLSADPMPRGELVELTSPTDIYRLARSTGLPMTMLAYGGESGHALREALAMRAAAVPDGLFVSVQLEGLLDRIPATAFRDSPLPELEHTGMETIALAVNPAGDRLRWTTVQGPEALQLSADPAAQANAIVAFMKT